PRGASFFESFRLADDVLRQAVQGISDIIVTPGLINRDFSDIRATMSGMGYAMLGTATAQGENAAIDAARQAINSPLLDDSRIKGSRGDSVKITVIATGFQPENAPMAKRQQIVVESRPAVASPMPPPPPIEE